MVKVSTGYQEFRPKGSTGAPSTSGVVVLFDPKVHNQELISPRLALFPGEVAFINAFNLMPNERIFTNYMLAGVYALPTWSDCCPPPSPGTPQSPVIYSMRMTLGNPHEWIFQNVYNENPDATDISKHRTQMVLSIPGLYTFEVETREVLNDLFMCYTKWRTADYEVLPNSYYGGLPRRIENE